MDDVIDIWLDASVRAHDFVDPRFWQSKVGDTVTDVRAAQAAGAQSVSVLCGFGTHKELLKAGTQAILQSTSSLAAFLTDTQFDQL